MTIAGGTTNQGDTQFLPITDTVKASAASQGHAPDTFFSTTVNGTAVREIVSALPPGYVYQSSLGPAATPAGGGALQITAPLTGVNHELNHLAVALWVIVLVGVVAAVLLGLALGRTVLRPLNSLTGTVEELAETTDATTAMPKRLDPGGADELGRLRRAFNQLLAALDSSRDSQRQLVLDASHELRTPLTSLRTNMEVARRLEELDPHEREVLINDVHHPARRAHHPGRRPGRAGPRRAAPRSRTSRSGSTRSCSTRSRWPRPTGAAVASSSTPRVAPTWVSGSSTRIGRAVDNLLDNALKWSPDRRVVEVTCADGVLVVRDHGPGVDDSDVDHIFDRFYRAPSARGRPGSGLGLAIVAQVARDEGGTVDVYQAQGGGALFRFSLPVVPPPDTAEDGA